MKLSLWDKLALYRGWPKIKAALENLWRAIEGEPMAPPDPKNGSQPIDKPVPKTNWNRQTRNRNQPKDRR